MRDVKIDLDVHRLIEGARSSFEQSDNDILRELLGLEQENGREKSATTPAPTKIENAIPIGLRTTGQWSVEFQDTRYAARNLREAYVTAIACLAEYRPDFLQEFSEEGKRRKFVARTAEALYPNSPHLAAKRHNNWHKIGDWYVDLNLSSGQAATRVRRACALTGQLYGRDLVIKEGLESL